MGMIKQSSTLTILLVFMAVHGAKSLNCYHNDTLNGPSVNPFNRMVSAPCPTGGIEPMECLRVEAVVNGVLLSQAGEHKWVYGECISTSKCQGIQARCSAVYEGRLRQSNPFTGMGSCKAECCPTDNCNGATIAEIRASKPADVPTPAAQVGPLPPGVTLPATGGGLSTVIIPGGIPPIPTNLFPPGFTFPFPFPTIPVRPPVSSAPTPPTPAPPVVSIASTGSTASSGAQSSSAAPVSQSTVSDAASPSSSAASTASASSNTPAGGSTMMSTMMSTQQGGSMSMSASTSPGTGNATARVVSTTSGARSVLFKSNALLLMFAALGQIFLAYF